MTDLSNTSWAKRAALVSLTLASGMAQAHTGHGVNTLMEGLAHPLGLDHLLAMVAVGVWSVRALPAGKTWQGPFAFLLALLLGAVVGATALSGVALPYLEQAIALSVVLFGAMLVFANSRLSVPAGLGLVALAASLHGLAHGAELPTTGWASFSGYAAGFVLTTMLLHGGGVLFGLSIQRFMAQRAKVATAATGLLLGGAGLYLLQQL